MDIRLPNGHVIKNVPENVSKEEVKQKAIAMGLATAEDFSATPSPVTDDRSMATALDNVEGEESLNKFAGGINDAIASTLGMPVDAANWLLKAVGVRDENQYSVGSSESIKDFMQYMGLTEEQTTADPTTISGRIGQEVGYSLAPQTAALGLAARSAQMAGRISQYFKPVVSYAAQSPLASSLATLGISLPAGAGGYVGGELAENLGGEGYRATGDIAGTIGASGLTALGVAAGKAGANLIKQATVGDREQELRAAGGVLSSYMSPESKGRILTGDLDTPKRGQASTGQVVDDPMLLDLQRTLEKSGPERARGRGEIFRAGQSEKLKEGLTAFGGRVSEKDMGITRDFFNTRIENTVGRIEERLSSAIDKAKTATQNATNNLSVEDVSATVSKYLDSAYDYTKKLETEIWNKVGNGKFDTTAVRERATDILRNVSKNELQDVEPVLFEIANKDVSILKKFPKTVSGVESPQVKKTKKLLDVVGLNKVESVEEVQKLKSRIGKLITKAKKNDENNKARLLTQVYDSILNDIQPATFGARDVQDRLENARKFSASLHETFNKGAIGKIRGLDYKQELKVAPEKMMDRLLAPDQRGLGYQALIKTANGDPIKIQSIQDNTQEFLKAKFKAVTTDDVTGAFNNNAAKKFINDNAKVLDEFPELKRIMSNAFEANNMVNNISRASSNRIERVRNASAASKLIKGEVGIQLENVFKSNTPRRDLNMLRAAAAKDRTGKAMKGLKGAFYEAMIGRVVKNDAVDAKTLNTFLNNNEDLVRILYKDRGVQLLREIAKGASIGARGPQSRNVNVATIANERAKTLKDVGGSLGVLIGSRLGKILGTNELLIASKARSMTENRLSKWLLNGELDTIMVLVEDALYNPELAGYLLKKSLSPKEVMNANKYAVIQEILKTAGPVDD